MNRRAFLATALAAPTLVRAQPSQRRPNIVLIVADDLGYAEIGVQGCKDIPTPNIDSIAKNGIRFTSGYVSCPVCSPTRAGLMTGKYQQRFGHEFNPGPPTQAQPNFGLPLTEVTIADRLKQLGYATGMVGKWHLGFRTDYLPPKRGFQEFFGFPGGANDYINTGQREGNPILRNFDPVQEKEYLTDAFAREATSFIERNRARNFFLYLPFNAVHAPLQPSARHHAKLAAIADTRRRTYASMMMAMDDAIGAVLAKLRQHNIEDDTLIFFHSDNGGPTPQTTSQNTPLRGFKGQTWDGGIRVPFLMQWKRRLPKGIVYDKPVIALDIHPTAVAAAGGNAPAGLDGVNLLPFLTGQNKAAPHEALYWRFGAQWAIRKGDWKLTATNETAGLFNLAEDVAESKDLSATNPAKRKELQQDWDKWNATLVAPAWRTVREGAAKKKKKKQ